MKTNFLKKIWEHLRSKKEVNVYFVSGMCYNCSVFDGLVLPTGFKKIYIEWLIPEDNESLTDYARRMIRAIDVSKPFALVGYSLGGIIVQEMNRFLSPLKTIIISSFKKESETPMLFRAVKRGEILKRIPDKVYASTEFITDLFNRVVYHMPTSELAEYMTVVDPRYIKWAVKQITEWVPSVNVKYLYHIHGTEDQIFPYKLITGAFPIEGGDHLMVVKKALEVNDILSSMLLRKES